MALVLATAAALAAAWKDTTDGIHAFLTFDSKVDPSLAAAYADRIDYVWGSTESKISWWRASKNPNVVLSKYIPFTRDPGTPRRPTRRRSARRRASRASERQGIKNLLSRAASTIYASTSVR